MSYPEAYTEICTISGHLLLQFDKYNVLDGDGNSKLLYTDVHFAIFSSGVDIQYLHVIFKVHIIFKAGSNDTT